MGWALRIISAPQVLSPSIEEVAAHLALGDLYDVSDLHRIMQSAASIATEMCGRPIGQLSAALLVDWEPGMARTRLPLFSAQQVVTAVYADGTLLDPGMYSVVDCCGWKCVAWTTRGSWSRIEVQFSTGSQTLTPLDAALFLILCGDLYRSRESASSMSGSSAVTARLLADIDRAYYVGPYA